MKKIINYLILSFTFLFLTGCSVDSSILNPASNPSPNKIKSLKFGLEGENIYKTTHFTTETAQTYNATLFKRTIANNILESNDDGEWGYIDMTETFNLNKFRGANISFYILPTLALFGNPLDFYREIQYEISIYDSNRKLIKTYVYTDYKILWVNIYNAQVAPLKSNIEQVNNILRSFEEDIMTDADFINSKLSEAGKIK